MKTRLFDNLTMNVSEIGLGCWQFGGDFGPMEEERAVEILHTATAQGVNFLDTADVYGGGRSEEIIGKFLSRCRQSLFVATKYGRDSSIYPNNYTKENLRSSVIGSLQRLGLESLDLLQLHCLPQGVLQRGEIFQWLREMKQEGLIKSFGASVESIEEGLRCLEQEDLASLQVIFNIFRQKLISDLFPQAQSKKVAIIVRLPLASGMLSGKFTKNSKFAESDHRNYNCDGQFFNIGETFAGIPFTRGVELVDELKQYVPQGMSMAQMALRWILDHEAVTVVIPGASSTQQVVANSQVSTMETLPSHLHKRLEEFYQANVVDTIRGPY